MNGSLALISEFNEYFNKNYTFIDKNNLILFFPPATYFDRFSKIFNDYSNIFYGAQDCSLYNNSSRTGEISASIIKDIGCNFVILGHSERRDIFNETNKIVFDKAQQAIDNNLKLIICIGENQKQKNELKTQEILDNQIKFSLPLCCNPNNTIIAYEPVWAIGSGKTPTLQEIEDINMFIKSVLRSKFNDTLENDFKILYGGSVNSGNISNILDSRIIDGVLVGGASLNVSDFGKILKF